MTVATKSRKHIRFIAAPQGSPEWLALRQNGIGASEIGGVLGQHDYMDPIKVYLTKVGEPGADTFEGNRFSRFGKVLEEHIANWYQYWEHGFDVNTMLLNIEKGNKQRRIRKVNGYYCNDRWPWLYASLDRIVWKDPRGRIVLETKNTTGMEKKRYTYGFNPAFYLQVQQQMMIFEADGADVGIYYDGNNFDVKTVEPDYDVQNLIAAESKNFWGNVLKAREVKRMYAIDSYYGQNMDFIPEEKREAVAMLQSFEPELTGSENEYEFIRKLVVPKDEFIAMEGTQEQWELLMARNKIKDSAKGLKKDEAAINAKLILSLGGYHQANFGDDGAAGYFSYKPIKGGAKKLYVSPKISGGDDE